MASAFGSFQAFTKTAATGATSVTFNLGGVYDSNILILPSMPSGTNIQFRVSDKEDGTYRTLFTDTEVGTSPLSSAPVAYEIPSSVSNCAFQIPHLGQYCQLVLTSATTLAGGNAYEFKILCSSM